MNPPTATPRTDASKCRMNISMTSVELDAVPADFARQLETELVAAKAERERLQWELDAKDRGFTAELARLRAENEDLAIRSGLRLSALDHEKLNAEAFKARAEKAEAELVQLRAQEGDYIKIIAEVLECEQRPACEQPDNQLEAPWEVVARLRAENDEMRVQIEANKRKGGGCQCADDEACAHVRRAERAEAKLHDVSLDLSTANHMIKLERDRADALQTRLNEINAMLKSPDLDLIRP